MRLIIPTQLPRMKNKMKIIQPKIKVRLTQKNVFSYIKLLRFVVKASECKFSPPKIWFSPHPILCFYIFIYECMYVYFTDPHSLALFQQIIPCGFVNYLSSFD